VIVVPILLPRRIGIAWLIEIRGVPTASVEVAAKVCKTPMAADELCTTMVVMAPTIRPSTGMSLIWRSRLAKASLFASGFMAALMPFRPTNKTPKAKMIWPRERTFWFLKANIMMKPAATKNQAYSSILAATIQAVMVVPILAPMMTPIAWLSVIRPALTNPTTMTVVADELWMIMVTRAPTMTPRKGVPVSMARIERIFSPAVFCRPSPICCIPNINRASPPNRAKIECMSMFYSWSCPNRGWTRSRMRLIGESM